MNLYTKNNNNKIQIQQISIKSRNSSEKNINEKFKAQNSERKNLLDNNINTIERY